MATVQRRLELQYRDAISEELDNMSMMDIIRWLQWEDSNGDFEELTFKQVIDICVDWFESIDDMDKSLCAFLEAIK